jgi:hypothetical protein
MEYSAHEDCSDRSLYESVPPKFYGGTERIVSYLIEELVRQGRDVTLFASGDSKTPTSAAALAEAPTVNDTISAQTLNETIAVAPVPCRL